MDRPSRQLSMLRDDARHDYPRGVPGKRIQSAIAWIDHLETDLLRRALDWRSMDGDGITDPLRQEIRKALGREE